MTTVGDPLTDIGWMELLWMQPVGITSHDAALTIDEFIERYEAASDIKVGNRHWYRAFNAYKMAVICLIGAMLVDEGASDDHKSEIPRLGIAMDKGDLGARGRHAVPQHFEQAFQRGQRALLYTVHFIRPVVDLAIEVAAPIIQITKARRRQVHRVNCR
jgi:hypothetical protein